VVGYHWAGESRTVPGYRPRLERGPEWRCRQRDRFGVPRRCTHDCARTRAPHTWGTPVRGQAQRRRVGLYAQGGSGLHILSDAHRSRSSTANASASRRSRTWPRRAAWKPCWRYEVPSSSDTRPYAHTTIWPTPLPRSRLTTPRRGHWSYSTTEWRPSRATPASWSCYELPASEEAGVAHGAACRPRRGVRVPARPSSPSYLLPASLPNVVKAGPGASSEQFVDGEVLRYVP
jgi:hypothetical protein